MLQSIEHQSGLPIAFDPAANAIHWPEGVSAANRSVRSAAEMQEYLGEPDAKPTQDAIYTVYRGIARQGDAPRITAAGLRYDITVIPAGYFVGKDKEFFRTAGHYHALAPPGPAPRGPAGSGMARPEVYEVISGRAYWLIQQAESGNPSALAAIFLIEAGPGEKALMPPGFGHISINARSEPLILANWIAADIQYDYEPYRRFRGGGYRVIEGETANTIAFEPNRRYERVPELIKLRPAEVPELGLIRSRPLYTLAETPEALGFLKHPEPFAEALAVDRVYRRVV